MKGFSILELLAVLALMGMLLIVSSSNLMGAQRKRDFDLFAQEICELIRNCRLRALTANTYAGLVFTNSNSNYYTTTYLDGNRNGIRRTDIASGIDTVAVPATKLSRASGDLAAAILPEGVPEIPPKSGSLDPGDPVRFGRSEILSFSPRGDASSGTLYLSCFSQKQMYAFVIYGTTARISIWKYSNSQWQMVEDR